MKKSSLIGHAAEAYDLVSTETLPADSIIGSFFRSHRYLGSHDRKFIAETVYGLLRHRLRLEWIYGRVKERHPVELHIDETTSSSSNGQLLCLLYRVVVCAESIESIADELDLVSQDKIDFSRFFSEANKINQDLENESRKVPWTKEKLSLLYSFPGWMISSLADQYGMAQAVEICQSLNQPAPLTLRVNILKTTVDDCCGRLEKEGVETDRTRYSPFGLQARRRINIFQLESFKDGWFEVQDEGSQILPLLVDPKPTSKVVDACAGGGGKSLELAALMKNRGEIFALDPNEIRLDGLRKRVRRSGTDTIRIRSIQEHSVPEDLIDAADNVLVDAPCSGLGTLRRNPGMKWSVTERSVSELSEKQFTLLSEYAQCVKKNGRLVYATCSIMTQENEMVVERFLSSRNDFELIPPSQIFERYGLGELGAEAYVRLFPHIHGTDGFFGAVMRRKNT